MFPFLQEFGISNQMLLAAGVFLLAAIAGFVIQVLKRYRKDREKRQYVVRRMREEALDRALANPLSEAKSEPFEKQRRPFQVQYTNGENNTVLGETQGSEIQEGMFQLTEMTELSQRKYLFRCQETVNIGNQFGMVAILPGTADDKQSYCQIFCYGQKNYLRSTGNKEVLLKRKGKVVIVNQSGLKLCSGDFFTVEKTSYQIHFIQK